MCLTTKQTKPYIAEEDIICYKFGFIEKKNKFRSTTMNFSYKFKKLYTLRKNLLKNKITIREFIKALVNNIHKRKSEYIRENSYFDIHYGFHSLLCPIILSLSSSTKMIECIIPKGSKYYIDYMNSEYVSNKIILIREYEDKS
jgi:hypothetical protein